MPRPRHEVDEALQELYDEIPGIPGCKGLCWMSCGPIEMSQRERQRIREAGVKITDGELARRMTEEYWCEALGPDGRCAIYELRPLVCREWGAVEGLRCPWGCVPEGGWLSDDEGRRLLVESMNAGGRHGGLSDPQEILRAAQAPAAQAELKAIAARGKAGDLRRAVVHGEQLPEAVTKRKPLKVRR